MNEERKALVIYDNTGVVWGVFEGVNAVPAGVQGIIITLPTGNIKNISLDMSTNPPTAIIEMYPDTESEVTNLQNALAEHELRLLALEG